MTKPIKIGLQGWFGLNIFHNEDFLINTAYFILLGYRFSLA